MDAAGKVKGENIMNVLSCFDGMSCGQIALNRAGIKVDKYYASEIDKYAMQVTQANYPGTVQLGSITEWKSWNIETPDIIIGGSPCQGFSFAGKGLNFEDPRSKLFFTFIDILKHYKPKYFLLENVIMKKEHNDVISSILGELYPEHITQTELFRSGRLEPIEINSALVSAQNRRRLYWTNILGITQPKDKGVLLRDIIEENYSVVCGAIRGRNPENPTSRESGLNTVQMLELRQDEKTNTLTSVQKDNVVVSNYNSDNPTYIGEDKFKCLRAQAGGITKGIGIHDNITWRKLTPTECERLQTVPDNYTNHVSNSQRYKMLGNGWTVDVISHIFSFIQS